MIGHRYLAGLKRWQRNGPRWPLNRQISAIFAAAMLANAAFIIILSNIWDNHNFETALSTISPRARQNLNDMASGSLLRQADIPLLYSEMTLLKARVEQQSFSILYILITVAAVITFVIGHLVLGRMGRGLVNVAKAASRIADGDLSARATAIEYASREEAQLITDFNLMSASLQRAERELAESTASIAHELRTPLTILRGRLHGISDGVFALAPAEIDGLLFQVDGLARLVDDLQTLSLATSDRLMLTIDDTDLAEEARRVLTMMQPDLEKAGLQLVSDLAPAPLTADGVRLRQAIGAVLSNATRYAADSGTLSVITRTIGPEVDLRIIDRGPGLPDGADRKGFDRFWRGESSRARHTGGSGLGLAVVRSIVEAHGGYATLTNHIEGGTVFQMRLPCRSPVQTRATSN